MDGKEFTVPQPLSEGDTVAIVRPGNGPAKDLFPEVYEIGMQRLEDVFGLDPVEFPTASMSMDDLSAHPEKRAQDIMDAFQNPEIRGVMAAIGGDGDQIRVLRHLDPAVLRENPTRFYGYSDNTSIGLYLWNQGIVSFQGPMVMTELGMQHSMHDYTVEYAKRAFFDGVLGEVRPSDRFTDETLDWGDTSLLGTEREMEDNQGWRWINRDAGTVSGTVWGGCLEILSQQLQAARYMPDADALDGAVLAIETSEVIPAPFWLDAFLLALGERGLLERFNAFLIGRPKARHREPVSATKRKEYREQLFETVEKRLGQYAPSTPAICNLDFGHADPVFPLPLGAEALIDTEERRLRFE